ncbi:MFS transporter [Streptomyces sp. RS10V-4]|uniref:MFS transporter n=1 Tax=Streptomyces rhizoryzae TaxID=2932493 RepID=UPI0020060FAD|nr:MFS transporter [Streptomyces rhizoryzae]MCK7626159.1 MFS transporter [Streptomyces rhizoryzae]
MYGVRGSASAGLPRYLAVALLARVAEEGMAVAAVLLALARTGSAAQGAFVLTAWMAPHVLAAPLVGAAAGRTRRPQLFHLAALGGFAAAIAALAVLTGRAPAPVTLAVALIGGSCGPVVSGGLSGLVAALVPAGPARDRAYALDAATYNAASVAGPAAVGTLAGFWSPGPAMALLAGVAAVAAVLTPGLFRDHPRPGARTDGTARTPEVPRTGPAAGPAALVRVRELRAITAATCLAFLGIGGLTTTAVLLAAHRGSAGSGSALLTAFAAGALVGSLVVARWPPRLSAQPVATAALLGTGMALGAAALVPAPAVVVALFVVAGLCDGPLLTATLRIRAEHAPAAVRTQVFTLGAGLKITAAACGAGLTGLAAALPPTTLLLGIAALQIAAALLHAALLRVPSRRPPVDASEAGPHESSTADPSGPPAPRDASSPCDAPGTPGRTSSSPPH